MTLAASTKLDLNGNSCSITSINANSTAILSDSAAGTGTSVLTISNQSPTIPCLIADGATRKVGLSVANPLTNHQILTNNSNTFSGGLLLANFSGTKLGTRLNPPTGANGNVNGSPGAIINGPYGKGPIIIGAAATDQAGIFFQNANCTIVNDIICNTEVGTDFPSSFRVDATGTVLAGKITANLSNAGFATVAGNGTILLTGQITGSSGLQLENSTGFALTMTLNNSASTNNYAGDTLVGAGNVLQLGAANQIPDGAGSGNLVVNGTFKLAGFNETVNGLNGAGSVDGVSGTTTFTVGNNNVTSAFAGIISNTSGTLNLVKTGTGTQTLSGASTFSGTTTISAGTLSLFPGSLTTGSFTTDAGAVNGALTYTHLLDFQGTGTTPVNGANFVGTGAARSGTAPNWSLSSNINSSASGSFPTGFAPASGTGMFTVLTNLDYNALTNGVLTITGLTPGTVYDARLFYREFGTNENRSVDFNCAVGANALNISVNEDADAVGHYLDFQYVADATGTMTYTESNSAGTPLGNTCHWYAFSNQQLPATSFTGGLPATTTVSIAAGATLNVNGAAQTVAQITGTATSTVALGAGTLTFGDATPLVTFPGAISGTGGLVKQGSGIYALSGTNTYTGNTTISTGTLSVPATGTLSGSNVKIAAGAFLRGNGTLGAGPSFTGAGAVFPGDPSLGNANTPADTTNMLTNGTLANLTAFTADFTNGGTFRARVFSPDTSHISSDKLTLTNQQVILDSTSILELHVQASGNYSSAVKTLVMDMGASNAFNTVPFSNVTLIASPSGIGSSLQVLYVDATQSPTVTVATYTYGGAVPTAPLPAYSQIYVQLSGTVTPVTVDAFQAEAQGAGVALNWNCVSEFQNAGFNIYRRPIDGKTWTRVNPTLIAGRVTNPDSKQYRWMDWAAAGVYEYKLESVDLNGAAESYRTIAGPVFVDPMNAVSALNVDSADALAASLRAESNCRAASALSAAFAREAGAQTDGAATPSPSGAFRVALVHDAQGNLALPATVSDFKGEAIARAASKSNPETSALNPSVAARWFSGASTAASSFTAAKVLYSTPGVLLIPTAMIPAGFDVGHVSIQREGVALTALARTPAGLVVYAQGYQDDYTDKDTLFLRNTSAATAAGSVTHASGLFSSNAPVNTDTPASVTANYHDVYYDYNVAFHPFTFTPWFSSQYLTDGTDQSFSVATPAASSAAASMTVNLWSLTQTTGAAVDHALQVLVNGQPVGQAQWSGGGMMMQLTFQLPSGALNAGANQVDLVTPPLDGVSGQICFLHSLTMNYTRTLDASQPVTLTNNSASPELFELGNLPSANVWIVDTRFTGRATLVPYESQAQNDGTYRARFSAAGGGTGQFLAVPFGQENQPVSVAKCTVKPIANTPYLAVGPSQFGAGVQPILAKHNKEGMRGTFVDQEQIFNYYNYGRYSPVGIQNAVRAVRPQYLLLLGRTTYDYLNYSGLNVDPLCPTFLVSTSSWAQTTSDSTFGDLGRGYPEVAVGRLPVNNPAQLSAAVTRILNYAGAPQSGIRVQAVADQIDPEVADFASQSDAIAQSLPDMSWQKNYLGVTSQLSSDVNAAMTTAANGGADWIIYVGHGNASRLGKFAPRILDVDTVQAWTGNVVFLQSTCTANWAAADETVFNSIAVQALTQPQGGICASIASSTYMNSDYATQFMSQLMKNADASGVRWGDALMKAQQWAYAKSTGSTAGFYGDLNKTEQIFGDPAMPVFMKVVPAAAKPAGSAGAGNAPASGTF